MQCPKCRADMEAIALNQYEAQRCTQCKGLWFDGAQHKNLKREKGADTVDIGPASQGKEYDALDNVPCPRCDLFLARRPDPMQPHIHYDVCPQGHGVFFDAGEYRDFVKEDLMDFFKGLSWFSKT